jgi:hypothetical protein
LKQKIQALRQALDLLRGPEGSHIEHVAAAWGVLADDEKDQE